MLSLPHGSGGSRARFPGVPAAVLACLLFAGSAARLPAQAGSDAGGSAAPSPPVMDPTKPAFPGILTNPDPTKPPPFVILPHDPVPPPTPIDNATAAISPALRARIEASVAAWKENEGAGEFFPGLTFLAGKPIIMLVTSKDEPAARKLRRHQASVAALAFLLDPAAFDRATICIVAQERTDPAPIVRNHVIPRDRFETTARAAASAASVEAAVAQARSDAATAQDICTALGID